MNISPFSLSGKTIIITGASSGIGKSCALAADKSGASLLLFGRSEERLEETLKQTDNPERHRIFSLDLSGFDELEKVFDRFKEERLRFHGLIHCAGISTTLPLSRTSPEKIQHYIETNVSTAIQISSLLSRKHFIDNSGASIVLLSSVMGLRGEVGKTLYSLTKGALIAASRSMALELAAKKIRVNCVSPGVVLTPMSENAIYNRDEGALNNIKALHPLGLGNPEDVAYGCMYLLSDAARWITGTNLIIDGGYTAR